MISSRLREETKDVHLDLERTLIPFLKESANPENYVALLRTYYSFHKPLEEALDKQLNDNNMPQYAQRYKSQLLANDIQHYGGTLPTEMCSELPQLDNVNKALGALYVIEGSTMGGKVICGMLAKMMNKEDREGLSFFNCYADNAPAMFGSFKEAMNQQTTTPQQEEEVLQGAADTFKAFKAWIVKNHVTEQSI